MAVKGLSLTAFQGNKGLILVVYGIKHYLMDLDSESPVWICLNVNSGGVVHVYIV